MRLVTAAAAAFAALAAAGPAKASGAIDWIAGTLAETRASYGECTAEAAAIDGTLSRINGVILPDTGKVIVVNIPSGIVTAYEDGVPVIESKAVVGKAATPTPELNTHVTYVRPNPTWTVPRSIIKRNKWLERLVSEPEFFEDNNFSVVANGVSMSPWEAASDPGSVETFVQAPGPGNALGSIKIGIENSQAIYLHDTNDPGKFDSEVRAASAGCVRIERVTEMAAWIMGMSPEEMTSAVEEGSTAEMTPPEAVRVILGYWTAWPDSSGITRFYPDIYGKDAGCGGGADYADVEEPDERRPAPRFIPGPVQDGPPEAVWTEYEAR